MTKPKKGRRVRLAEYQPIRPLAPDHKLMPTRLSPPPLGKFKEIDGQLVLDFSEDESADD